MIEDCFNLLLFNIDIDYSMNGFDLSVHFDSPIKDRAIAIDRTIMIHIETVHGQSGRELDITIAMGQQSRAERISNRRQE
jgi:hypothetical protein